MNAQSLLGFVREQALAVTAAEQEGEPGEVRTELNDVVSATSDESTQRLAEPSRAASIASQSCTNRSSSVSSARHWCPGSLRA
jgi:hypothetical protein